MYQCAAFDELVGALELLIAVAFTLQDIPQFILGDDQADAGSKTFEREHEMSLANNARDMLDQVHHALDRLDKGTYGACENCAKPVGKLRLQAFPRATLCMACKQAEERY
jgi:RNA polymerase-binding protein DksA